MSKRRADHDQNGDSKRQQVATHGALPPKRYTVRLLIPLKLAGNLIGKGGVKAKALRSRYAVNLVILTDARGPETLVRVEGDDLDNICNCIQEISEKLQEDMNRILNLKEDQTEIRIMIHKSQCGCIIGKGGTIIKSLREESGAAIRVNTECCPNSTDRVCQITGIPAHIVAAFNKIMIQLELEENKYIKGDDRKYNVDDFDETLARDYGGFTIAQVEPGKIGKPRLESGDRRDSFYRGEHSDRRDNGRRNDRRDQRERNAFDVTTAECTAFEAANAQLANAGGDWRNQYPQQPPVAPYYQQASLQAAPPTNWQPSPYYPYYQTPSSGQMQPDDFTSNTDQLFVPETLVPKKPFSVQVKRWIIAGALACDVDAQKIASVLKCSNASIEHVKQHGPEAIPDI